MDKLKEAADKAISEAVYKSAANYRGGWALLIPKKEPLLLSDLPAWTDWLQSVIVDYNVAVAPKSITNSPELLEYDGKKLFELRNAMVAATT